MKIGGLLMIVLVASLLIASSNVAEGGPNAASSSGGNNNNNNNNNNGNGGSGGNISTQNRCIRRPSRSQSIKDFAYTSTYKEYFTNDGGFGTGLSLLPPGR